MPASQVTQLAQQSQAATKIQQQPRGQPTSFLVTDNQQAGYLLTDPSKTPDNPPSVASAIGKESQHSISRFSRFFTKLQSVMSYQQIHTPQTFSPSDMHPQATSPPTTTAQQEPQHQPSQPQPPKQVSCHQQ